jgi:undecaprenyl-diphosphatase
MGILEAIVLAIIEGLTEFLPVSSTGHMIIASAFMGIADNDFTKLFEVCIQLGTIMAVVVLYWKKFINFKSFDFYIKLIIAVIPALIIGKLLDDWIDENLGNPIFISAVLVLGGIILLFVDNWFKNSTIDSEESINKKQGFIIGCYQCLAVLFPGLSRSAATIIGGMQQGLTRKAAAEFSFFLAVPTMAAATGYKLLKYILENGSIESSEIKLLAIGNVVGFLVAIVAIKFFINFLTKNGFKIFGYYRIAAGVLFLLYFSLK